MRISYLTIFSALSGAFGGLLAFGLTQISAANMRGWQWMYLIEGILSFCLVPITWWRLPNNITEAKWLTADERAIMALRMERNKSVYDKDERLSTSELLRCLRDWKVYVHAVSHFGIDSTLYSLSSFMPKIVAGMGFTTTVNAQLLTVPVYVVSAAAFVLIARFSDKMKLRSPFILGALLFALVGYVILAVDSTPVGVRYFALFLIAVPLYSNVLMNVIWASNNHAGYFKRAFATGLIQLVGNSSGACIGFIYKAQQAPRYKPGMHFSIGMTCMSFVLTTSLAYAWRLENNKKRKFTMCS